MEEIQLVIPIFCNTNIENFSRLEARIAEASCKACLDRAEEAGDRQQPFRPSASADSLQEFQAKTREGLSAFPRASPRAAASLSLFAGILRIAESDSALGLRLLAGRRRSSSPETGLAFAEAGASERRKAWRNSRESYSEKWKLPEKSRT